MMTPTEAREEVRSINAKLEQADDPRFGVVLVRERIEELKASGEDVPEALTSMEKRLVADCVEASQGR